ncbi:uncharacterized protein LOC119652083 [Hermetia illucens]|uniref:uncharacterized protein LOC119652083 n=1 Tax=Hermetia illucens TaxID=343691 RepID=UPI0018CC2651|nr:uncharacterized protein LOC119652083 [Hermetia illucens]
MVERPFELPFESLIKEARSISVYDGNNEKTALQPWLIEVNDIILVTNPGPQRAYIFNIIMSKIQGPARQVIQRIINPNWESMRAALIANFGVTEPYTALVNEIHRGQKTKIFHKGNLILFLLGIITVLLQIKSTLAQPSLQVEEVHSATGLLLIKKGNEKLIRDYKRIYHKIDLRQYELALLELEKNIAGNTYAKHTIQTIKRELRALAYQNNTISRYTNIINNNQQNDFKTPEEFFKNLFSNRQKRGLFNFIGTGYKLLFGVLDNDDLEEINEHLTIIDANNHNLIESLNKQVKINTVFQDNLNKITNNIKETNNLFNILANETNNNLKQMNKIILNIQINHNLDRIKDEIEIIIDNLNSAKNNLMTRSLLTMEKIEENNISFEEIKEITLSVLVKQNSIIFIINVPIFTAPLLSYYVRLIPNTQYETLNVKETIAVSYNNEYFEYNKLLKNLKQPLNCTGSNMQFCVRKPINNITKVEEIEKGLLLVININGRLIHDCNEKKYELKGHYIVKFTKCKVQINRITYKNTITEFSHTLLLEPIVNNSVIGKEIKLEDLRLENIENLKQIEEIKYFSKKH